MKNYLVKSLFEIGSANWHVMDRSHEHNLFDQYQQAHQVSLDSFRKHLLGDWELVSIGGKFDDINQAFEQTFWHIHDLWHKEPCNIFYTDPDTVAVKDIDPWNEYREFRMFNYTDPKSLPGYFDNFFNAGVRYFPHTMSEQTWQAGTKIARTWNHQSYDTEQIILNTMLWSQQLRLGQVLDPRMAYQAQWLPDCPVNIQNAWNDLDIKQAKIIHVHSSRNIEKKLNLMKTLKERYNV